MDFWRVNRRFFTESIALVFKNFFFKTRPGTWYQIELPMGGFRLKKVQMFHSFFSKILVKHFVPFEHFVQQTILIFIALNCGGHRVDAGT